MISLLLGDKCCVGLEGIVPENAGLDANPVCRKKQNCFKEGQWLPAGPGMDCCEGLKPVRKTGDPFLGVGTCSPKDCVEEGKNLTTGKKCCPLLESSNKSGVHVCILKTCNAKVTGDNGGKFTIVSNDYPNDFNKVEVVDDDGYLGLLIFNSKIDRYRSEYIITNEDKNLIRDSFLRAKKYWRENYGLDIKDEASFEENIKNLKVEDIRKKVGGRYGAKGPEKLHEVALKYFENLGQIEQVLKQSKLDNKSQQKLASLLRKEHDKHGYYVNSKPVGNFCGVKDSRDFESDNILRQSVCSKLGFENNGFEEVPVFSQSMSCNVRYKFNYQEEPMGGTANEVIDN